MTIEELIKNNRDDEECRNMTICLCKAHEGEIVSDSIFWDGNLLDIPEEYYGLKVLNITQHLSEIQDGSAKFYVETIDQKAANEGCFYHLRQELFL